MDLIKKISPDITMTIVQEEEGTEWPDPLVYIFQAYILSTPNILRPLY